MSFPQLSIICSPMALGLVLLTGACGAPLAVTGAGYAADGGLLASSHKTSADHMISMVSKQDCALWRVIVGRAVCKEREGDTDRAARERLCIWTRGWWRGRSPPSK